MKNISKLLLVLGGLVLVGCVEDGTYTTYSTSTRPAYYTTGSVPVKRVQTQNHSTAQVYTPSRGYNTGTVVSQPPPGSYAVSSGVNGGYSVGTE